MKFFTSAIVVAALFSTSEAIKIQGNNDGLGAILGAIIAGGNNSNDGGCEGSSCEYKPDPNKANDAARKVIE